MESPKLDGTNPIDKTPEGQSASQAGDAFTRGMQSAEQESGIEVTQPMPARPKAHIDGQQYGRTISWRYATIQAR